MRKRSEATPAAVELVEEFEKVPPPPASTADIFENAHEAQGAPLDAGFERIVERIFVTDVFQAYERLEKALRVGEKRSDHGSLMRALDEAETEARLAHRLYVTSVIERKRWELDNEILFGEMRRQATHALQREKEQGYRSKQITDADVTAMCATMWPDEWRAQEMKRATVKAMEESIANLDELANSRCRSLQTMLGKSR